MDSIVFDNHIIKLQDQRIWISDEFSSEKRNWNPQKIELINCNLR